MKDFNRLTIKNLNKNYGLKKAIVDFNLELEKGEFVTLLGPSGCGKSTALNCIAGLIPITSGEICIDKECIDNGITRVPPEKRQFGMVFQSYALFPHLNVFNNIAFGLQVRHVNVNLIREKVLEALKMIHLDGYGDKFPAQLSGGEQQRIAIARSIVLEPQLLMLDEPLSNLDTKLRIDMRYEIKALHNRLKITSLYVTHDQHEALALSDKIVVMKSGHIQQIGRPEEIYSRPANLFVADFLGFRNIWSSRITDIIRETHDMLEVKIDIDGIQLTVRNKFTPGELQRKEALLKAHDENRMVFTAIRPEDIEVGSGRINQMHCTAGLVEYLGQVCQVSAVMKNGKILELRPKSCTVGESISFWADPESILLFPGES